MRQYICIDYIDTCVDYFAMRSARPLEVWDRAPKVGTGAKLSGLWGESK